MLWSSWPVSSTVDDDCARDSSVAALLDVVSARFLDMLNIRSVTPSCCEIRLFLLLCLSSASGFIVKSSALSPFSISSIVPMFAFLNACNVFENCSRCASTSLDNCGSFSSLAQSSSFSMPLLSCDIFARPASLSISSSWRDPRKTRMSYKKITKKFQLVARRRQCCCRQEKSHLDSIKSILRFKSH